MSGNVCEWCFDIYGGFGRVWRGGGFASANYAQVGYVYGYGDVAAEDRGFRVVRTE